MEVGGQLHMPGVASGEGIPQYPLNRRLGGHQRCPGSYEDKNLFYFCEEENPRSSSL
jgi:hypothetical protein